MNSSKTYDGTVHYEDTGMNGLPDSYSTLTYSTCTYSTAGKTLGVTTQTDLKRNFL